MKDLLKKPLGQFALAALFVLAAVYIVALICTVHEIRDFFTFDIDKDQAKWLQTVFSSFVGAILAFIFNDYLHRQRRREENEAALYGTFFNLQALYDDFLNYRLAVRETLARSDEGYKQWPEDPAPLWAYARPMLFPFRTEELPDLKSLHFLLLHDTGRRAFQQLQLVERAYSDLSSTHEAQHDAAQEMQIKLATLQDQSVAWAHHSEHLGGELRGKTQSLILGVVIRIEKDEERYVNAFRLLKEAAHFEFGRRVKFPELEALPFGKKENLPVMPEVIVKALQDMKRPTKSTQ